MSASFAPSVCGTSTGPATAVNVTVEQIDRLAEIHSLMLEQTLTALDQIKNITFNDISTRVNYNPDNFVDRVDRPARPDGAEGIMYNAPTPPSSTIPQVELSEINYEGPSFSVSVMTALTNQLLDFLSELNTLPDKWANMLYGQARDREIARGRALEEQTVGRWTRLGWQQPQGAETRQIDAIRLEVQRNVNETNRQIMITQFQEALTSLRFGIEQALRYVSAWVDSARAEVAAQGEANRYQLANSQILLDQLRQKVSIYVAEVQGESTRVQTELDVVQKDINLYQADIQERGLLVQRDVQQADNALEEEDIRARLTIQEHQAILNERRRDLDQAIANVQTQGQIIGRVSSASFSAMDIGSSISSNSTAREARDCSTTYSYRETRQVDDNA